MAFHRCVLVVEKVEDAPVALAQALLLAPQAELLMVLSKVELPLFHWMRLNPWSNMDDWMAKGEARMDKWKSLLPASAPRTETQFFVELTTDLVSKVAKERQADLILMSPLSITTAPHLLGWYSEITQNTRLPVVSIPGRPKNQSDQETQEVFAYSFQPKKEHWLCVCQKDIEDLPHLTTLLKQHSTPEQTVTFVSRTPEARAIAKDEIEDLRSLLGIRAKVKAHSIEVPLLGSLESLVNFVQNSHPNLVLLSIEDAIQSIWGSPLLSRYALSEINIPMMFVPPKLEQTLTNKKIFGPDLWVSPMRDSLLLYVEQPDALRIGTNPYEGELTLLAKKNINQILDFHAGYARISLSDLTDPTSTVLGLGLSEQHVTSSVPLDMTVHLLHPKAQRILLYDVELTNESIERLLRWCSICDLLPVGVRLTKSRGINRLRKRLNQMGEALRLLDAGQILDDGDPRDIPFSTQGLRMLRVALRMRSEGTLIHGIVVKEKQHIAPKNMVVWEEQELPSLHLEKVTQKLRSTAETDSIQTEGHSFSKQLSILSNAEVLEGNDISYTFQNQLAREALINLLDSAQDRIHLQIYIIQDDPITALFEQALLRAVTRGVKIRILVDSLYSLHGSFGMSNPWIERMDTIDSVEIQLFRPIVIPDLEDLKQRDHRKFVIVDGHTVIITGRNFSASYFTDFSEIKLTPETSEDQIPWVDTGVHVKGPVVQAAEQSFLQSWTKAGGTSFPLVPAQTCGTTTCRFISHEGLCDTYTLDAQLALIRNAQTQINLVNTFPLQYEVLHALLQALGRGVNVRILIGNVRPLYGDQQTFPGSPLRILAGQVVLSRIDPIVAAGGEAYEYAIEPLPHWDPSLLQVRPHVHAKILTCDGQYAGIGSANYDITGGFWESESLLLLEDTTLTQELDHQLNQWIKQSVQVEPNNPRWKRDASLREWLDKAWPSIIA